MKRLALLAPVLAAVLVTACSTSVTLSDARSISERDGILYIDDVPLEYHKTVALEGLLDPGRTVRLATAVGLVDVSGAPGSDYNLTIDIYTEFEGDGTVEFDDGELLTFSQLDGKLLVNGIRGTVPEGVSLEIQSGTGEIILADFQGEGKAEIGTGTGVARVSNSSFSEIRVSTGTGDLFFETVEADQLRVDSGTGLLSAEDSHFQQLFASSGTGDFRLRETTVNDGRFDSGTGDVILVDSNVSELRTSLGTGDVVDKEATP